MNSMDDEETFKKVHGLAGLRMTKRERYLREFIKRYTVLNETAAAELNNVGYSVVHPFTATKKLFGIYALQSCDMENKKGFIPVPMGMSPRIKVPLKLDPALLY
jgi:hypothetical protein